MKLVKLFGVILVVGVGLVGCKQQVVSPVEETDKSMKTESINEDQNTGKMEQPTSAPEASEEAEAEAGETKQQPDMMLEMSNFKYSQTTINVKAGTTVTIALKNTQGTHDFVIDELGVKSQTLQAGQDTIVTLDIPKTAQGKQYEYYCSIGQHRQMGMKGMLIVK